MTIAYRRRKKAIRAEKRRLNVATIPRRQFLELQANWQRRVDGPPIGTLQDLVEAKSS